MTAPQTDATTDPQSIIAALQQSADAALAREGRAGGGTRCADAATGQRNSEYGERIEQQAATIDVLKVMSASPGDPQPVFDLIVRRREMQCNSGHAGLFEYDGMIHFRSISASDLVRRRSRRPTRACSRCRRSRL